MKPIRSAITLAAGIALVSLGAHAQTTQGAAPATTPQSGPAATSAAEPATQTGQPSVRDSVDQSQLNRTDRRFLENAIQGSHAEISGSQLALEKSEDARVREFAEMMIKDHEQMVKDASSLAAKKGVEAPDGPSVMQMTEITALKALSGGAFDAMYVNRIGVAAHESTVEMFEEAGREAEDPDVKAMVEKALPKLREHLEMARALNAEQDRQDDAADRNDASGRNDRTMPDNRTMPANPDSPATQTMPRSTQ